MLRIPITSTTTYIDWILKDTFPVDVAAGSLDDTNALPIGGLRTVTDTEDKLSISSEQLVCSGGKSSAVWGDPGLWYEAIDRQIGITVIFGPLTIDDVTKEMEIGLDTNQSGEITSIGLKITTDEIKAIDNGDLTGALFVPSDSTSYYFAIVLNDAGAAYYLSTGDGTWTKLGTTSTNKTLSLYPAVINYNASFTLDTVKVISDTLQSLLFTTTEWNEAFVDDGDNGWIDNIYTDDSAILNKYLKK